MKKNWFYAVADTAVSETILECHLATLENSFWFCFRISYNNLHVFLLTIFRVLSIILYIMFMDLIIVDCFVCFFQTTWPTEILLTLLAAFFISMNSFMYLQMLWLTELLVTFWAAEWFFISMNCFRCLQMLWLTELLFTLRTSMKSIMGLQITWWTEWQIWVKAAEWQSGWVAEQEKLWDLRISGWGLKEIF